MSPLSPQLHADCTQCCGLCCVAPAFYADQGFGFDKPAHQPCAHLHADFRCAVHGQLERRGFPACAAFDCHGAGQRVTRMFGSGCWRSAPEQARHMFEAYRRYRALHELMMWLSLAIGKTSPAGALRLADRRRLIDQLCESGAALDPALRVEALRATVLAEMRGALNFRGAPDGS